MPKYLRTSSHPCRLQPLLWVPVITLALHGCGGGGGGGDDDDDPIPQPVGTLWTDPPLAPADPGPGAVLEGIFRDSVVEGLSFESGGQTGTTGADGAFTYENGTMVTFSIGSLVYGDQIGAPLMTPMHLATAGGDLILEIRNRLRFIQALDVDGDPENGITISEAVRAAAASWPQIDFTSADITAQVQQHLDEAGIADGATRALPSETAADAHFARSVRCAYSGVFRGTYAGDDSGVFALSVDFRGRMFGIAYSNVDREGTLIERTGELSLSLRPTFTAADVGSGPARLSGRFETPDHMLGGWTSDPDDGSFQGARAGGSNRAAFRIADYSWPVGTALLFNLEIDAANAVSGIVIDLDSASNGVPVSVSGTLAGETLTASSSGNEYSITANFDLDNPPNYRLTGTLRDARKNRNAPIDEFGCRLN